MTTEDIKTVRLIINSEQAGKKLDELNAKLELTRKKREEALEKHDTKGLELYTKEVRRLEREQQRLQTRAKTVTGVLRNMDKATPRQLRQTIREMTRELNSGTVERGSRQWEAMTRSLRAAQNELAKINKEMRAAEKNSNRLTDLGNKWVGFSSTVFTAWQSVLGGIDLMEDKINAYAGMEEHMSQVRKYTGMSADAVQELNEEFKKMDTRTVRQQLNDLAGDAGRLGITGRKDVLDFVRATPEEERAKSSVLMVDDGLGYKWAFIKQDGKYINQAVDQMSALYRDDRRELDTELKIVPVRMDYPADAVSRMVFIHSVGMEKDRYVHKRTEKVRHIIMVTDDTRVVTGYDGYSINDAVSGDGAETDTNKRDVIEVAVNTPDYWKIWFEDGITDKSQRSWDIPVPVGNPYIQDPATGAYHTILKRYSFVLDYKGTDEGGNVYGTETIRHDVLEGYRPADTRVQWVVSFLDDGVFEPGDLYVIRNKKYLCQKLEFTINEDGVSPLKKGYFYEVSE